MMTDDKPFATGTYFTMPEKRPYSKWRCQMFGSRQEGVGYTPLEGDEPNWFWRKMQYLILGFRWDKQ